jgi:hypothetical protein
MYDDMPMRNVCILSDLQLHRVTRIEENASTQLPRTEHPVGDLFFFKELQRIYGMKVEIRIII